MAQIGDILAKLGRNETLNTAEQQQIRLWGNTQDHNSAFITGLQNGQSSLNVSSIRAINGDFEYPPSGLSVKVKRETDTVVANSGTITYLDLEEEFYDDASMWDVSVPSKIFIKRKGKYQVIVNSLWGNGGSGSYQHVIVGIFTSADAQVAALNGYAPSDAAIQTINITSEVTLETGSYLKVGVRQQSATTPTLYFVTITVRLVRPSDDDIG